MSGPLTREDFSGPLPTWQGADYLLRGCKYETDTAAGHAQRQLRAKLDAAALEVLAAGGDWAEGPLQSGEQYPSTTDGPEPFILHLSVPAGRVEPDWIPPHGWRVIRHSDWVAAGRPGR